MAFGKNESTRLGIFNLLINSCLASTIPSLACFTISSVVIPRRSLTCAGVILTSGRSISGTPISRSLAISNNSVSFNSPTLPSLVSASLPPSSRIRDSLLSGVSNPGSSRGITPSSIALSLAETSASVLPVIVTIVLIKALFSAGSNFLLSLSILVFNSSKLIPAMVSISSISSFVITGWWTFTTLLATCPATGKNERTVASTCKFFKSWVNPANTLSITFASSPAPKCSNPVTACKRVANRSSPISSNNP